MITEKDYRLYIQAKKDILRLEQLFFPSLKAVYRIGFLIGSMISIVGDRLINRVIARQYRINKKGVEEYLEGTRSNAK